MRKRSFLALMATIAATPVLAQTQTPTRPSGQSTAPMTAAPPASRAEAVSAAEFVRMAAMSDMYELQASRLAEQHAQNTDVKQFAQRMMRDHQKTTTDLQNLVRQAGTSGGLHMPTEMDQRHMQLIQQLQGARGAEFDRLYITQQMQAHQQAVDLFRNYGQQGDNTQLRQWASATLPALQEHLKQVQDMQRGLSGQGGTRG